MSGQLSIRECFQQIEQGAHTWDGGPMTGMKRHLRIDRPGSVLIVGGIDSYVVFSMTDAVRTLRAIELPELERQITDLRSALTSPEPLVRSIAAELLAKLGTKAIATPNAAARALLGSKPMGVGAQLTEALRDADAFVRSRVAQALVSMNRVTDEVINVLRTAATSKTDRDTRELAKETLRKIDPSVLSTTPPPPSQAKVQVGECRSCHRPLRVKAHAVKSVMTLTCKCGEVNTLSVSMDQVDRRPAKEERSKVERRTELRRSPPASRFDTGIPSPPASTARTTIHKKDPGTQTQVLAHDAWVKSVAFSPDGGWVATGSTDGTARLWELATGREVARFSHHACVNAVAFSPNSDWLATAGDDAKVRLWELATNQEGPSISHEHEFQFVAVTFSPDGDRLAMSSWVTAEVWEFATLQKLREVHQGGAIAFSPDGTLLATADVSKITRVWELAIGQVVASFRLRGIRNWASDVAFSPDGSRLATGSKRTAWVWELTTGHEFAQLSHGRGSFVNAVAFSPDGALLATGGLGARVWELATGKEVVRVAHAFAPVHDVAFDPTGCLLVTASIDQTARIWAVH